VLLKPIVPALLNLELTRKRKRWPSTGRRNQFGSTDAKQPERERPHKAGCASVFQRWQSGSARLFSQIATLTSREAGRAWVFVFALAIIMAWAARAHSLISRIPGSL
jgi:hypothetical protein